MRSIQHTLWGFLLLATQATAQVETGQTAQPAPEHSEVLNADASLILDPASRFKFHSSSHRWDNDGSFAKPFGDSDKHYTNGVELDLAWTPPADWWAPDWWIDTEGDWERFAVGVDFVQHIYTATEITDENPPLNDRPYAGYLAFGLYLQRASATTHDHIELNLGLVGEWAGGETAQKWVHRTLPVEDDPEGWDHQLANEPTINLSVARTWKITQPDTDWAQFDLLPSVSADLGTAFTRASFDLTFRIGPSLPDDFGTGRLLAWRDATGTGWDGDNGGGVWGWKWYVYTRLGVRAVARDITLDGNTWKNSRSVNHEPIVGEFEIGFRARHGNIELGYQLNTITKEYTTQDGADSYGEISLTIYF